MSNNNAVPTEDSMIEFSEVILRAIELSWRDDEFKNLFIKKPMYALEHYFHYKSTWNFQMKVKPAELGEDCRRDVAKGSPVPCRWDEKSGKWHLPQSLISFGLPRAPAEIKDHAVALALYNDAGPMYLFTCC